MFQGGGVRAQGSPSVRTLQAKSRSRVRIGATTVFLYAPDEVVVRSSDDSCSADEGAQEWHGHYDLITVRGRRIVGRLSIGEWYFVERRVYDGLRVAPLPSGDRLLAIHRYATCATSEVAFYRLTPSGAVERVRILSVDGHAQDVTGVSHSGFLTDPRGRPVLCTYDNAHSMTWCEALRARRAALEVVDRWAEPDSRSRHQWPRPTQRARARVVAFEFGKLLTSGRYDEAAKQYDRSSVDLSRLCTGYPAAPADTSCPEWVEIRDAVSRSPTKVGFELHSLGDAGRNHAVVEMEVGPTRGRLRVVRVSTCRQLD
jgi:hypothetical protein